ncbi:MAG: aminoglycoside phosphotransferase [Rhizobiales bacterium]|nr:aminoglycoside phosphotransferase [Hyphomicrobiales bacterium]
MATPLPPEMADADHLTEALRRSGALAGGRVVDVAVERSFPTILSHIFRLRLTYEGAADGAPGALVLKAGLIERPGGPWHGGQHEVAFYRDVAPAMPAGLMPRCFDAHVDPETGAWHLLLEDLSDSHAIATQWPLPPTIAQCERIVRTRARFQAAWWDDPRLGLAIGRWDDSAATDLNRQGLAERFARFADDLGDRLSAPRRALYERFLDSWPRLIARYHSHRAITIVQGDAHVWNCFLPRGEGPDDGRLFDWDGWRLDVGSDDLAYMMAVHWYPDFRAQAEQHLLDCHHDALIAGGVQGYDRRALQEDYRLSALWQIATPVWQHANGIPPVIWWNNFERIHLAVDDLGCRELLAG